MEDTITCPVCGEANPADLEFCLNCQWRLRPLAEAGRAENGQRQRSDFPIRQTKAEDEPLVPEWLRDARRQASQSASEEPATTNPKQELGSLPDDQDLLGGLASQKQADVDETPAWVARITGVSSPKETTKEQPGRAPREQPGDEGESLWKSPSQETPEEDLSTESSGRKPLPALSGAEAEFPSDSLDENEMGAEEESGTNDGIYDWLRKLDASTSLNPDGGTEGEDQSTQANVPDWVKGLGSRASRPGTTGVPAFREPLPEWLQVADQGTQGTASVPPEAADRIADVSQRAPSEETEAGRFLDSKGDSGLVPTSEEAVATPSGGTPAFTPDSLASSDVDAILASMQMPDWLSDVIPSRIAANEQRLPVAQDQESIAPAELPSWVQAMRPVESALPTAAAAPADMPLEERGPLVGLHGVLPAIPGAAAASSKPKVHSIRLDSSAQQQAHAALLEGILAAESNPTPMTVGSMAGSQRGLRWVISALLLILLGGIVFSGSQVFPLPAAVPNETIQAIQAVESIPPGAPVLVVFDYEPATVGEMEATAASLMDHLLLLQHPKLALLSTSPTGSALAERFISTTLAARAYGRGAQYENLGYLPGGLAGVHAFAQDPPEAMPLLADSKYAWDSGVLSGVTHLSDFAAIIVLTDGLESGRVWIEQTVAERGAGPMIIVSSAQAGPMLLPYADAGQVTGLVAGINGAAGAEQANGGLPGYVRRYWDAYSLGLYVAVFLIVLGGAWHFWLGIQERRALPAA